MRPDRDERMALVDPVLLQLGFDQREGQRGSIHRTLDRGQHVRHTADVILVSVGEHQRGGALWPLLKVCEIRRDQVDAE